jgi:hypothetical protein
MQLFAPDEAWPQAASKVRVFILSTQFVRRSSDKELAWVLDGVRREGFLIGVAGEINIRGPTGCGFGVNGYSDPSAMNNVGARLRRFGANLSFMAMDEPLWYGHMYGGPGACHDPIDVLAGKAAQQARALQRWFPNVEIGDIEPINRLTNPSWMDVLGRWMSAYEAATGKPLAFIDADLVWQADWRPQLRAMRSLAHSRGARFGVIFDGDARDETDSEWTAHAAERFGAVVSDPQSSPDDEIIWSWQARPAAVLPESTDGTLTNLVVDLFVARRPN